MLALLAVAGEGQRRGTLAVVAARIVHTALFTTTVARRTFVHICVSENYN